MSMLNVFIEIKKVLRNDEAVHKRFEHIVKRHPNKTAILFKDEKWTFMQIQDLANKVAIYFEQEGYQPGDCIALVLHNCPEYTSLWLGLSKLGLVIALINTNLVSDALIHSIKVCGCKAIIYGSRCENVITTCVEPTLSLKCYEFNRLSCSVQLGKNCINLEEIDPTRPLKKTYVIKPKNALLYIFTSGTTGLPKPAIITHTRYNLFRCYGIEIFKNIKNPIIYSPMPMYHTSGVSAGIGPMVLLGATTVIREKFSASNYWRDCKEYNCNAGQYIGEMLRYVLAAPDNKVHHSLEAVYGNGLKRQVWTEFVRKFKVKRVVELYGATEGTFILSNADNTIGSVGYIPPYLRRLFGLKLIRYSEETGEPIRDNYGFCIECKGNEPGLAIKKLNTEKSSSELLSFKGYLDQVESDKKILRDVFQKGDCFFNSGDLLGIDKDGYYFFVDRVGDTFRWKGENVSTTEIESIISNTIGLEDAVVYGVKIPGTEGRAGMVTLIDRNHDLDVNFLLEKFKEVIPSYAIPIFVRVANDVPLTSTFKHQKFRLRSEGFNIEVIRDPMYFYNSVLQKYVPLTEEVYANIISRKVRI